MTRRRRALRGAVATGSMATVAAAVPIAGTPAYAGTGQVAYECQIFSTKFDYNATVTVNAPASAKAGDEVTVEADFSDLPGVAPLPVNKWTTASTLTVSGAQSGSVPIAAPERTGPIPARAPIPIGKVTGRLALSAAGTVQLAPAAIKIVADAGAQATIDCTPKSTPAKLATINVAENGPILTVSPATIHQGGDITLEGSGWESGAIDLALCDANGAACQAEDLTDVAASVDGSGKLSGSAKIAESAAPGARTVVVTQGAVSKRKPLTVTQKVPPPTGNCKDKPVGKCGEQKINLTVTGGPLTMSQQPGEVELTPVTLDGTEKAATGDLRQVKVVDARGGITGWSLIGTLTDFTAVAGTKIPAGNLSWTPKCTAGTGASPVTPGSAGPLHNTTAATLCSAADGAGQIVGGEFDADASLNLKVPAVTGAGQYTAVLTLTLS